MPITQAILMIGVFAALGIVGLLAGLPDLKRALASRRWNQTHAQIEDLSESLHSTKARSKAKAARQYHVRYIYTAEGKTYSGKWDSLSSTFNQVGLCVFKKGGIYPAFYNPDTHSESRLFRTIRFQDVFLFMIGFIFLTASVLALIIYIKTNK